MMVKRYSMRWSGRSGDLAMHEDTTGKWCHADEVCGLEREIERLRNDLSLEVEVKTLLARELQAEVNGHTALVQLRDQLLEEIAVLKGRRQSGETKADQSMVCYWPCEAHKGQAWTMLVTSAPPYTVVCPICRPPKDPGP